MRLCATRDYDGLSAYDVTRHIATQRRKRHESYLKKEDIDDEQAGIVAEVAFAKRLNLDPTPITTFDGSGGYDFVLPGGWTVDVKSSWQHAISTMSARAKKQYPKGRLMVSTDKVNAMIYVYGIVHWVEETDSCDVEWVGWSWEWQVKRFPSRDISTKRDVHMRSYRGAPTNAMEDLWTMATAEPVVLAPPISETTMSMDGGSIVTMRAPDGKSFQLHVDGELVCFAYLANGKWYDVLDVKNVAHDSIVKVRTAAMKRLRNRNKKPTPVIGSSHYHDRDE